MILLFIVALLLPLLLSLLITPMVIKFANRIGATDIPEERKVHTSVMPRIGGLAIFLSAAVTILTLYILFPEFPLTLFDGNYTTLIVGFCFISLFGLGFRDDLKPLTPQVKFGVQLILAAIIYFAGFKISNITNPLDIGVLDIGIFDFPITVLWIVGITNAFNLIDGLDGLASGVAVIACISIFIITSLAAQVGAAVFSLIIAGALIGFLRYNFNPAKIFLGDSGSLIIGFALALLSIQGTAKITTGFAILLPILILVFPITDTLVSMIRRLIGSFLNRNPQEPPKSILRHLHGMFTPDKLHIHHRLLSLGLSHRSAVLVLYMVSAFFAFSAFLFTQIDTLQRSLTITFVLVLILFIFIKKLRYHEMAIFNNGLILPFYENRILKRSEWTSFADIFFIVISYSLSYALVYLVNPVAVAQLNFGFTLLLVLPIQLATLWITGLYREKMTQLGIANAIRIIASIGSAVGITGIAFLLMEFLSLVETAQFLIFNFYFLLTLLFGYRIAYQALSFWYNRDKKTGKNVLIYGTGEFGTLILQNILTTSKNDLKVIGFLDDDPDLEGKIINGYPIFGGHWTLSKTHQHNSIDYIYLCDENIRSENLRRLRNIASQKDITIKKLNITLQEIEYTDVHKESIQMESENSVSTM
jgi:UDP-GlcNAc:undecaprenyl-phosphate/decaprenyl-phosphate GlcNAc-1-phosphate transferase